MPFQKQTSTIERNKNMKIIDIPQSGKRGLYVTQNGRFGPISRAWVVPANPQTPAQMNIRAIMTRVAAGWRALTEAQRAAWTAVASGVQSASRLGTSGPLTGSQLFNKINCSLSIFGQAQVDTPPARPQFAALAPTGLVITNTADVIALKLTCAGEPGDSTIVRGSAPISQGRSKCGDFRVLGMCPAAAQGAADITSLYVARYGVPGVGDKVFVRVNQIVDGWEDQPVTFAAIVPQAS
jgi:hypothetical protein